MLVPMRAILEAADRMGYGQGAFNMNGVGQVQAAIQAFVARLPVPVAEASNAFMGGAPDFFHGSMEAKRVGAKNLGDAVKRFGEDSFVPIALHLDHGKSLESVKACIDGGYTSVMIDGSDLPYEENVALTREVVRYAHSYGVTVEGELGVLAGVEDQVFSEDSTYTNPVQAVDFFKKTGCDALAISYGTCHGPNKGKDARIRKEIAIATKECMRHEGIRGFLVSHGSSTVPQEYVQAINAMGGKLENAFGIEVEQLARIARLGISKINVDTDLRLACTRNILKLFQDQPELTESIGVGQIYRDWKAHPQNVDPRSYIGAIRDAVIYGKDLGADVELIQDRIRKGTMSAIAPLLVQFGSYRHSGDVKIVTCEQMAEWYKKEGL